MVTKTYVLPAVLALVVVPFLVVMLSIAIWGMPSNHLLERIIMATLLSSPLTSLIISSMRNLGDSVKHRDYIGMAVFTWLIASGLAVLAFMLGCILYGKPLP